MNLANWSATRVLLLAAAWPLIVLSVIALRLARFYSRGSAAFVSFRMHDLALFFGPPLALILIWLLLRA